MMKVRLALLGSMLLLAGACSSRGGTGQKPAPSPQLPAGAVQVTLGAGGEVQSTATAAGPGGSSLTLNPGTRLAVHAGGTASPPASGASIFVGLATPATVVPLPASLTVQAQVRVVVAVDGAEVDADFWTTTATPGQGARLVLPVTGTVTPATLGLLYDVTTGTPVRVATATIDPAAAASVTGTAVRTAASGGASGQMNAPVPGSGSYGGGTANPPAGAPTTPSGVPWSRFTVADPGCLSVGGVQICGPTTVDRVTIEEESTAEILGICFFGDGTLAATAVYPPGYQFFCERVSDGAGGTIVTVWGTAYNLPLIDAHVVRASDQLPMMDAYVRAQDGLHLPSGETTGDPYPRTELQFAGFKPLVFRSSQQRDYGWVRQHALDPLTRAGYQARLRSYAARSPQGFEAEVDVYDTLAARSKLEQEVVLPEGSWTLVAGETRGNKGTYESEIRLEHLDVNEGAGVLTLTGRFGLTSCDGVAVLFGANRLTPTSCADSEIRAPVPATGGAPVAVEIGGGPSNVIPLTEWKVHWDMTELQENAFDAVGTLLYALRFDVAFRADVHDLNVAPGTAGRRSRVDFVCENGGKATAEASGSATTTFPGLTEELTLAGTGVTTNRIPVLGILDAPGDYLVCEGYVDLDQRKVAWAVMGTVSGPTSTLKTTVQFQGGGSETSTQTDTVTLSKRTWIDPALPDTMPWPYPSTPYAGAWLISLDGALALPAGGHSSTYLGVTQSVQHQTGTPTAPP